MANDAIGRARMKHAYDSVRVVEDKLGNDVRAAFQRYAKAAPATLRRNGLGQTVAMWRSRASTQDDKPSSEEQAYQCLFIVLQKWLCGAHDPAPYRNQNDLLKAITGSSQRKYLEAQNEAELYLDWIKKFANALLTVEKQDDAATANGTD